MKHNLDPEDLLETCKFYIMKLRGIQKTLQRPKKRVIVNKIDQTS